MRIGINCGHTKTGVGSGAVGYLVEGNETRNVGAALMCMLKEAGHTVVDCTVDSAATNTEYLSVACNLANAQSLDLFVSIHFNAGGGKGVEVFTYKGEKHEEAVNTCARIEQLGFVNRGVKDGSKLYVLKHTKAKAMLIECCFVDTKSDAELYQTLGPEEVAKAICEAITGETITTKPTLFSDVPETDVAYNHIKKLKDYGIINGYGDGTFKPDATITRREAAIMISNALTICGK